ncbi:MAG: hypothetical protein ABI131_06820 [Nostocoides sp.]
MTDSLMRIAVRSQLAARRAVGPRTARADDERGDVPGWVLVTLMTAGLVTALWTLASGQLQTLFTRALNSVTGP